MKREKKNMGRCYSTMKGSLEFNGSCVLSDYHEIILLSPATEQQFNITSILLAILLIIRMIRGSAERERERERERDSLT